MIAATYLYFGEEFPPMSWVEKVIYPLPVCKRAMLAWGKVRCCCGKQIQSDYWLTSCILQLDKNRVDLPETRTGFENGNGNTACVGAARQQRAEGKYYIDKCTKYKQNNKVL